MGIVKLEMKCGLKCSSKSLALLISACKINKTLLVVMVEMEMKWVYRVALWV
jgi:hypothetical protein